MHDRTSHEAHAMLVLTTDHHHQDGLDTGMLVSESITAILLFHRSESNVLH